MTTRVRHTSAVTRATLTAVLAVLVLAASPARAQLPVAGLSDLVGNAGQWNPRALYRSQLPGAAAWVADDGLWLDLTGPKGTGHVLRQRFVGSNGGVSAGGLEVPARRTFIRGDRRFVARAHRSVTISSLYPGVDLVVESRPGALKYDLVVAPGAHPSAIRFLYDGAECVAVTRDGALEVQTSVATLIEAAPVTYQVIDGVRRPVSSSFELRGDTVTFRVGAYDASHALVIDPTMLVSTYFGGAGADEGRGIALDTGAFITIGGVTTSTDIPTSPGAYARQLDRAGSQDLFVARLDPTGGVLLWATYLGGSGIDELAALRVSPDGSTVTLAGSTTSRDFPVGATALQPLHAGGYDGFISVLDRGGSRLVASTLFGGADDDHIEDLAINSDGHPFIVGWTASPDLPVSAGALRDTNFGTIDAFAARLPAALDRLTWSTYLGGAGEDRATGVALGSGGATNITGWTVSDDLPITAGAAQPTRRGERDGFIVRIRFDGSRIEYGTYFGGSSQDQPIDIALDRAGNPYVVGVTLSTDLAVTTADPPGTWFAVRIDSSTGRIGYARYIGTTQSGGARTVQVSSQGEAFIAGSTEASALPLTPDGLGLGQRGGLDVGFVRLSASGDRILHASVLGGEADDQPWRQSHLTRFGDLYVVGTTASVRFPTHPDAFDRTLNRDGTNGRTDAFVLAFRYQILPVIDASVRRTFDTLTCDTTVRDTFLVTNRGESELIIGANRLKADNGRFVLEEPDPRLTDLRVPPGGTRRYIVRFVADRPGPATDTLLIFSNDSLRTPLRVALVGFRRAPFFPTLPAVVRFPRVLACEGRSVERTFSVDNGGNDAAVLDAFRFTSGSGFRVISPSTFPRTVDTSGRLSVTLAFQPRRAGQYFDTLEIPVRGCGIVLRVPVEGIADSAGFDITEDTVEFPVLASCSGSIDTTVTVRNTGAVAVTFDVVAPPGSGFSVLDPLPATIPAGSSVRLRLRFAPPPGPASATAWLRLAGTPCARADSVELRGERRPSAALEAPPSVDFGFVTACRGEAIDSAAALVIRNASSEVVRIFSGTATGAFSLDRLVGDQADLAPGAEMTLIVHYRSAVPGADAGEARIPLLAAGCPDTLIVGLTAFRAEAALEPGDTLIDIGVLPECRAADTLQLVLRNPSGVPLVIDSTTTTDGLEHLRPLLPFVVPARDSQRVAVRFSPLRSGPVVERLVFFSARCRDSLVVRVSGRRVGAVVSWMPRAIVLPPVLSCAVDSVIDLLPMLVSSGEPGLTSTVVDAEIRGATELSFVGSPVGATVRSGDSLGIGLRLTPRSVGRVSASVVLVIDPCADTVVLQIELDVLPAQLELVGGSFDPLPVGGSGDTLLVVRNSLPVDVVVDSLSLPGPPFSLVSGPALPAPLGSGDSLVFRLRFAPTAPGSYLPSVLAWVGHPCGFATAGQLEGIAVGARDTVVFCVSGSELGLAGDTISVPVHVDRAVALSSPGQFELRLQYDPRRLFYAGASTAMTLVDRGLGTGVLVLRQPGVVGVVDPLVALRFVLLSGEAPETRVRLDSVSAPDELLARWCQDSLVVRIGERCLLTGAVLGKYPNQLEAPAPNPASSTAVVRWSQLEDAPSVLTLYDARGQLVLRIDNGALKGGSYELLVDVSDLAAGVYHLRIAAGSYVASRPLVIHR